MQVHKNKNRFHALKNAIAGLTTAWRKEKAFQLEVLLCFVSWGLLFFLDFTPVIKLILFLLGMLLLIIELVNSCIEVIVDRISLDYHPLSKEAKDMGSTAVLLACGMNAVAWIYAFYELFSRHIL